MRRKSFLLLPLKIAGEATKVGVEREMGNWLRTMKSSSREFEKNPEAAAECVLR